MVKKLSPSLEDYLEAILRLEKEYRVARVKDIAKALGVQMPSVTGALKSLRDKGLVNYQKNSFISLTETGKAAAEVINSRHYILDAFLKDILGLEPAIASAEACGIEHIISGDTAERIKNLGEYIKAVVFKKVSPQEWEAILVKQDSGDDKEVE
ncbi:MAG: metal-dependent transcriptional regulator [Spirochaetales bacterium]|nr:metal-dependent transcriptional regulator [Spirochaetales bacterium]